MGSFSMRTINDNICHLLEPNERKLSCPILRGDILSPMGNHFVSNPVRSIFDRQDRYPADFSTEFDPYDYSCNSCNLDLSYCFGTDFHLAGLACFNHRSSLKASSPPLGDSTIVNNLLFDSSSFNVGNNKQQLPPMGNHFVANPVRSVFDCQDQYPVDFSTEFDPTTTFVTLATLITCTVLCPDSGAAGKPERILPSSMLKSSLPK
ncbi:hypothetical protein L6452_41952 [Arctium lappa]|uniref:Uncharacterized protein n=1 Tax=Arctium lappa TaxID=4217 RepID=A0ACB8XGV0_ARCLA|nr:hypothetical protein L6452_41952 [Arctium lappa]